MTTNGETGVDFTGLGWPTTTLPNVIAAANASGALAIGAVLPMIAAAFVAAGKPVIRWGISTRVGQFLLGSEVVDLVTPGVDLPSPSDIPPGAIAVAQRTGSTMVDVLDWFMGPLVNFGGPSGPPNGGVVMKQWVANGRPFFLMEDGWTWVQKLDGSWKKYRQPKPVVLMPNGAGNLRDLLRATGVISRQLKQVDKALGGKLGPRRRRAPARQPALPRGTRVINIDND